MKARWIGFTVWAFAAPGLATNPAAAHAPAHAPALAGSWMVDAQRSDDAEQVFAAARGGAGGGMMAAGRAGGGDTRGGGTPPGRMIIRGGGPAVLAMLQAGSSLRIDLADDGVTLHVDEAAPFTLPLSGEAVNVTRWGQQVRAHARFADGTGVYTASP